jgi:hypothetical protein
VVAAANLADPSDGAKRRCHFRTPKGGSAAADAQQVHVVELLPMSETIEVDQQQREGLDQRGGGGTVAGKPASSTGRESKKWSVYRRRAL